MKFRILGLMVAAMFCTHNAFSQLQVKKIKYQGLALWDSIPSFPGGDTALANYWNVNLKPETTDTACKVYGVVYVKFWVESDGHIMEILSVTAESSLPDYITKDNKKAYTENCIKPVEKTITDKAMELAMHMPRWNATISRDGAPKRCKITLPVVY
jgi:hypothetical protein